ncbi:MAG: heavy-metal-associated domain-containing protein [Bacteroidales bacterium]|nr:heavy-metal-associated domain-containing protein [Bacteroidales bacterium]
MRPIFYLILVAVHTTCKSVPDSTSAKGNLSDSLNVITVDIQVNGMTCHGCEMTISKVIGNLEGVFEVTASYTDSLAEIKFDSSLITLTEISDSIDNIGYKVIR